MKQFVILLAAVAMIGFMSSESQAQYYRGGSGFSLSIGSGYGGFGGYGGGFNRGISYGYGRSYGGGFRRGCGY